MPRSSIVNGCACRSAINVVADLFRRRAGRRRASLLNCEDFVARPADALTAIAPSVDEPIELQPDERRRERMSVSGRHRHVEALTFPRLARYGHRLAMVRAGSMGPG